MGSDRRGNVSQESKTPWAGNLKAQQNLARVIVIAAYLTTPKRV